MTDGWRRRPRLEANRDRDAQRPDWQLALAGLLSLAVAGGYYHNTSQAPSSMFSLLPQWRLRCPLSRCQRRGRRQLSPSRPNRSVC